MAEKVKLNTELEAVNFVQELRKAGRDFEAITDKLTEMNTALEIRWNAIDQVKKQEKNAGRKI